MALPSLASVGDLAAWLGRTIPAEDARAGAVLSHASTRVRTYTGQTWVEDDGVTLSDVPDIVAEVTVRVAARAYRNPEDLDSVTVDDGTKRWGSIRGLALSDVDKEDLAEFREATGVAGFGVISTYRDDLLVDTIYVPTGPPPSGYPFPFLNPDDL